MEIYKIEEFAKIANPNPGTRFRKEILTGEQNAENIGGIFSLLAPGNQVPYHFHRKRECIIIAISGEATEITEGEEFPIKANDVLYIAAGEKHMIVNKTDKDFRYFEFFTYPPVGADSVRVE